MSADRYTADDLALAKRDGYELAISWVRMSADGYRVGAQDDAALIADSIADGLESLKKVIVGA